MTVVAIHLVGAEALQAKLKNISAEIEANVDAAVMETAAELEGDIKLSIASGPKTGVLYKRGNVVHKASAPGEAPASDTGALLGSIYHERVGRLTAAVGSRLVYALYLEYHMNRPFFRPAVERIRATFNKRLETAVRGATK